MRALVVLCLAIFIAIPALAGNTPIPPQKTQSLEILKEKMAAEEARKAALAKQAQQAEKDIAKTKTNMVDLGAKIRKNETNRQFLERRVQELTAQEKELSAKLEGDRGSMASTILGLERMRRVPPELLIVRPGAPLQTAQTALLLQNLLPALHQRAETLSQDIEKLNDIQEKLAKEQSQLLDAKKALDQQNTELSKLMAAREKEFKSANSEYRSSAAKAERYASEAQSLAELVSRIEDDNRRTVPEATQAPQTRKKAKAAKPVKGLGKSILPVSGRMVARFGDYDELDGEIQGIRISAPAQAIVVTPMAGTVKYAGTFRNYGQIIIVEHTSGYHSLIAGMGRTNVGVGQSLKAGEPLGYMSSSSSQNDPLTLYYELRHDGEAIDPSYLFADLKS